MHISFFVNQKIGFDIFDKYIIIRILNDIKLYNVEMESLFFDPKTKLSYLSAIIDFENEIFNHEKFDNYCIEICKKHYEKEGLEFSTENLDIKISYPRTIEPEHLVD